MYVYMDTCLPYPGHCTLGGLMVRIRFIYIHCAYTLYIYIHIYCKIDGLEATVSSNLSTPHSVSLNKAKGSQFFCKWSLMLYNKV